MAAPAKFRVGDVMLTRVPYFDIPLDPAVANLTAAEVVTITGAAPVWATDTGQVIVGQAVWVVESQEQVIVVDPCGAADDFIRTGPAAIGHQDAVFAAMRDAGFPPERVDVVVLSHLDGIGMTAVVNGEGGWAPAFPNARIVITNAELEFLAAGATVSGRDALDALIAQGGVDGVTGGHVITTEVSLELVAAHTPGHALVHVASGADRAVFVGHLLLNPVNAAMGDRSGLHRDGPGAATAIDQLLADASRDDTLLIGPLWPYPGAGFVAADGAVLSATPID